MVLLQSTKPNEFSPFVTSFPCEYAIIKISSVRYKSWQALPLHTYLFFEVVSPSGVNFLCFSPSWPPLQCVKRVTIVVVLPAKTIAKIKISTNAILDCSPIYNLSPRVPLPTNSEIYLKFVKPCVIQNNHTWFDAVSWADEQRALVSR